MSNLSKKSLTAGVLTGTIAMLLFVVLLLIKFGYTNLINKEEHRISLIFISVWFVMFTFSDYGISKKFYSDKYNVSKNNHEKENKVE